MTAAAVGLYVHLPWCERKCPYCDFNSYAIEGAPEESEYVTALLADLDAELATGPTLSLSSIFIGGGTPSLFSGAAIQRLLDGIYARCALTADVEITLEANPGSAERSRFADYRAAGVNRLSLGVQSYQDPALQALGRVHDGADARRACATARAAFENLNIDLMFGLPSQQPGAALDDLRCALAFTPQHLSWYQLTIEDGTAFARRPPPLPAHDRIADEHDLGLAILAAADFAHYEISAHARPGRAARHNLNYWRYGDYLGIGAGAHGKRTLGGQITRRVKVRHPVRYVRETLQGRAVAEQWSVTADDVAVEYMINSLRLRSGFTLTDFVSRTGLAPTAPAFAGPLAEALRRGWLQRDAARVWPTALGFRFLNDVQLLFVTAAESESCDRALEGPGQLAVEAGS